jgi:hypothetical protein
MKAEIFHQSCASVSATVAMSEVFLVTETNPASHATAGKSFANVVNPES